MCLSIKNIAYSGFPIALVFSESSMNNLQSVSIVAAFPIGIVMVLIVISFLKGCENCPDKLSI